MGLQLLQVEYWIGFAGGLIIVVLLLAALIYDLLVD